MSRTLTAILAERHLVDGRPVAGEPVALRFDQALLQDATGTLVMLTLEAMGIERVATRLAVQYVDHNLLQADGRNAEDHLFLQSAAARFGLWFSRPGNGISHPLHQERFGRPGTSLIGSDSHTPAAGAIGQLALGAGGTDVALALAGEPVRLTMPGTFGVRITGDLPPWVGAKDVVLELLRRHGTSGARGFALEYRGPGLAALSVMDRHVIANMGTELGATTSVFPSDDVTRRYLGSVGRPDDWEPLAADPGCAYDRTDEIVLDELVPLVAKPSSPGNVVPVAEVVGTPIHQAYVGSSANPGLEDLRTVAAVVRGRTVADHVSLDVNPATRGTLAALAADGSLGALLDAGARLHQVGCNGCIGLGQAPATGRNSLRTVPRNFPGRSGTPEDSVWLCGPEVAAASALAGAIADPRTLGGPPPRDASPGTTSVAPHGDAGPLRLFVSPPPHEDGPRPALVKGPNIRSLPALEPFPNMLLVPVLLHLGDDVSTDTILPAGARVQPFRSNLPRIAEFCFEPVDPDYVAAAKRSREASGHAIVAGANYGQGSSREHAALGPRFLGLRVVLARSFARIHRANLVNFGVLPLLVDEGTAAALALEGDHADGARDDGAGPVLRLDDVLERCARGRALDVELVRGERVEVLSASHDLDAHELAALAAGGLVNRVRADRSAAQRPSP